MVTRPARQASRQAGLLGKLMTAVRPEFRVDVLAPAADDPVLGWNVCGATGCQRPTFSANMCATHRRRWRRLGRPDAAEFLADSGLQPRGQADAALIDFGGLPTRLKLELQYAVQRRYDDATVAAPFRVVVMAIRWARQPGVSSLLDLSEQQWRQLARGGRRSPGDGGLRGSSEAFLAFARDAVESLRDGIGWEVEYPRDVWRLGKLPGLTFNSGRSSARGTLRFDRIDQPWLKDLGKRWVRLRIVSGLSIATGVAGVQALTYFSEFLTDAGRDVSSLADIDRPLLERYLAWLAARPGGPATRARWINALHLFFQAIRQYNWDATLPTTATFFVGDCPPRPPRLSRHLAEYVMAQVEQPANLDRWPDPAHRLVTLLLIRCGLRVSDACTLRFECLVHDGQHAPYLRYINNKDEAGGRGPDRRGTRVRDQRPATPRTAALARRQPQPVPPSKGQRERAVVAGRRHLPQHARIMAAHLRRPRRARPAGPSHRAPVATHLRHPPDQP
jgi:hypothetical protein